MNYDSNENKPKPGLSVLVYIVCCAWLGFYTFGAWYGVIIMGVIALLINFGIGSAVPFIPFSELVIFISGELYGAYLFAYSFNIISYDGLIFHEVIKNHPNISAVAVISFATYYWYVFKLKLWYSKTDEKNIEHSIPIKRGSFTDSRDGKTYKTVKIGNQVWMAENLCYQPNSGNYWAYADEQSNVAIYGYLYDLQTAKKVCPSGWHLPSKSEFEALLSKVSGSGSNDYWALKDGSNAYYALKDGGISGFSALFGGGRIDGYFGNNGYVGNWWSASEDLVSGAGAWTLFMDSITQDALIGYYDKAGGFSVRCLQD